MTVTSANTWTRVKLGDVASEVRERCEDPVSEGITRCIRGEDFESGETRVTRWGRVPEDMGPTFTKRFRPGQILYMTRRAYLRKGGMVEFDGVCANTTLVLEADAEKIVPELLPFIIQSEPFVEYAVDASVGSTNPFTKWKDLAEYEFDLPPLDRQREIVGVLSACGLAARAACRLATATEDVLSAHMAEAFASYGRVEMSEVVEIKAGATPSRSVGSFWEGDIPWIKSGELRDNELTSSEECITLEGLRSVRTRVLPMGTLLMAMYGATAGKLGILGIPAATNQAVASFHPQPGRITSDYLYWALLYSRKELLALRGGAAQPNLSRQLLLDFPIPLTDLKSQTDLVCRLKECDQLRRHALQQAALHRAMRILLSKRLLLEVDS